MNIFAIAHSRLNFMLLGTQRRCADGLRAELNMQMLDACFTPMS
jgi:hypothetical protein